MKRFATQVRISTFLALAWLAVAGQSNQAAAGVFGDIKKGLEKGAGAVKKGVGKAVGGVKKGVSKAAGDVKRGVEKAADDVRDAAEAALAELNPSVQLSGGARIARRSLVLVVNANVRLAGQRFNVQLFNAAVVKSKSGITVSRKVGKHLSVKLKIMYFNNTIEVDPTVTVTIGKKRLRLPVPSLKLRV